MPDGPSLPQPDVRSLAAALPDLLRPARPELCPTLSLWLTPAVEDLWAAMGAFDRDGPKRPAAALPYWAVAWPGGQALARHLLDQGAPAVHGRQVLDIGAGSGIAGIAAALSGARRVRAFDTDPWAGAAAAANARRNGVSVEAVCADPLADPGLAGPDDVVLVADLWYERFLGLSVTAWLRRAAGAGATVLIADVGRAWFPRSGTELLATYLIEPPPPTERLGECRASVHRLLP